MSVRKIRYLYLRKRKQNCQGKNLVYILTQIPYNRMYYEIICLFRQFGITAMEEKVVMMKDQENRKQNTERKIKWALLPLQFILTVFPLILYAYAGNSGYSAYAWSSVNDFYVDIFLHGKMVVFTVLAVVLLALIVRKIVKMGKDTRKKSLWTFLPMFLYLFFVLLSTICSINMEYSLLGSMDAKEPVGVLIGYVLTVFYAYLVIDSKDDLMQLLPAAVIGGFCMALLGVLQTIGKDPLVMEAVQNIYASSAFRSNYGYLALQFPVGVAYGTLFNPNYVGTYVAMYLPLLLIGLFVYKGILKKAVCGLSFVGLLVLLFSSQSRTGLIASVAVAVIILVFLCRELWKRWYLLIPGLTFLLMCFSLFDTYRDNLLSNRLKQMFEIQKDDSAVKGVDTTGNGVRVLYKDTEYTVCMPVSGADFNYIALEGKEQLEVRYNEDRSYGYFTLSNGDEIAIQTANYEGVYAFGLKINGKDWYFTNQLVRGNYKMLNQDFGRLDESVCVDNVFPGYESVASGRGYVWGRSIPLLLDNFVVGSGPDTFGIEFPQNDYVARYKSGYGTIIFTRPHNFYLQMGVQTGTLSLLAFLVFYITYFVGSCRRYFFCKFNKVEQWMGFLVFACTFGFMASGIANDSLIVVTPIFYVLLGMGMAINHKMCPIEKRTVAVESGAEETENSEELSESKEEGLE